MAKRRKLSTRDEEELIAMLQSGDWLPGDILPSERELMAHFGIGRPAIREAMQKLEMIGLVDIRHGGRARVAMPTVDRMFSRLSETVHHVLSHSAGSLTYLLEVREIIEMQMARTAAELHDPETIGRIQEAFKAQEAAINSPKEFMNLDGQFHLEIARASGNPIAVELCRAIFAWLKDFHSQWVRRPGLGALTLAEHRVILRAIEEADPETAALAMKTHLNRANSQYAKGNRTLS
jgi:DNA-binding FadR family transcriptional regulator